MEVTHTTLGTSSYVNSVPDMPVTVVYIMLPPGIIAGISMIEGAAFQGYFIFIFIAVLASFAYTFYQDRGHFLSRLKEDMDRRSLKLPSDSPVLDIGLLLMATLFFTVLSYYLVDLLNQSPTIPEMGNEPVWFNAYSLARAGVWEELVTRIPFLGIPLLLTHALLKRRKAPIWRYFLGGNFELDWPALLFLFMSSLFFGLAHAFAGWDVFKVLPAMVGGLAMGYLFLKWGLHAAILLHFVNDYLLVAGDIFGSESINMVSQLLLIVMVVIGAYIFYLYVVGFVRAFIFPPSTPASEAPVIRGKEELYGPAYPPQSAQAQHPYYAQYPQYPPQTQQGSAVYVSPTGYVQYYPQQAAPSIPYAPYPFRCIRCGGTVAMFRSDGKVVCTQCGMEYVLKPPDSQGASSAGSSPPEVMPAEREQGSNVESAPQPDGEKTDSDAQEIPSEEHSEDIEEKKEEE